MSLDLEYYDWLIVENGFHPDKNREMESIFSIGNGKMGQRANFEEAFSGDSLQGSYIGGVYYPDRTRVGWWKNGYPEYFAKVINAINWIGIDVSINNQELDLAKCRILDFKRTLNMKEGFLERTFRVELPNGNRVGVHSTRFLSIVDTSAGAIKYSITAENFDGEITIKPYLDLDVKNEDSNYNEKFWEEEPGEINKEEAIIIGKTKKLDFRVCTAMYSNLFCDGKQLKTEPEPIRKPKYLAWNYKVPVKQNEEVSLYKYVINKSSLDHTEASLVENTSSRLKHIFKKGFQQMLTEQKEAWAAKWLESDIRIEGDTAAQQGIRFNIFQLNQTYTGEDERLNIGPKGFTGEKYGGSTYWDTEAYALPFYLSTAGREVARNLLLYRYKHLERAIENATKLGFNNGAALYPMVTMNGEECHNEWEITFEEIHRNGAIAFAIFNYIRYTG
ncbi:MAG: glycoside hydrolase family 65 protein, partial [Bacteroidetes bacterium]